MANTDEWVSIRNKLTGGVSKVHRSSVSIWLENKVIELVDVEEKSEDKPKPAFKKKSQSSTNTDDAVNVDEDSGE